MASHHPHLPRRPKADLYLCEKCGEWKPGEQFGNKNRNPSSPVYAKMCRVCRSMAVGRWIKDYYHKITVDPAAGLAAIRNFPPPTKVNGKINLSDYYKWKMALNSLLSRIKLTDPRPPFDIVAYVNRKVKYGRLTTREAEDRIEDYYRRHPEARKVDNDAP